MYSKWVEMVINEVFNISLLHDCQHLNLVRKKLNELLA